MSKNFGKCFGPSTRDLSFRLRCPSFLLSKFASQLKLIQSVVRVGILGICVTSSFLRVLLSGFWVSGPQVPSSRDLVPGSWVPGSHVPWSHDPCSRVLGVRAPESQVPGSQRPGSRVSGSQISGSWISGSQDPGSRVSGPDFRLCL